MSDPQLELKPSKPGILAFNQQCCCEPDTAADGILIAALGNSLRGEDGVGIAVVERLSTFGILPQNIHFQSTGSPSDLLEAMFNQRYRKVIVVDAAYMNQEPGEWQRLVLGENTILDPELTAEISMHNLGLGGILELCSALNVKLPEIIIYGVQPDQIGISCGLSDTLQSALPEICSFITEDILKEGVSHDRRNNSQI